MKTRRSQIPLAKDSSPKSTAICIAGDSSDVLDTGLSFSIQSCKVNDGEDSPETLAASTFQVSRLEQLALGVVASLQDHQVQVNLHGDGEEDDQDVGDLLMLLPHLVAPIPIFSPECVGSRIGHLSKGVKTILLMFCQFPIPSSICLTCVFNICKIAVAPPWYS